MKRHKSPNIDPVDLYNSKILTILVIQYIKKLFFYAVANTGQVGLIYIFLFLVHHFEIFFKVVHMHVCTS